MTKLTTERVHDLKIYPEFFSAVCTGIKRAELRKNDRDYRVGDVLHLCEFSKTTGRTGEYIDVIVTHIADVSDWLSGYVLLSIKPQENDAAPVLPKQPELPQGFTYESGILTANFGNGDVLISDTHWPESGHAGISFAPVPQPKRPNLSDYTDLLGGSKTEDVGTLFIVKSNSAESLIAIRNKLDIAISALSPAPAQPVIPEQCRSFVTDADIAALHRFAECCDDPESGGHDLEKKQVQRLEKIGALQRSGRISYITDFGDYLISATAPVNAQQNEPQNIPENIPAQPVSEHEPSYRDGLMAAAKWVEKQREAYDSEHGQRDPDTGSFEFGNDAQRDYSETLAEIAEGIRALHPVSAQPVSEPYKLPQGYALVPCKLTAENGAKSCMIGEFTEQTEISCPECFGDDECETCDGSGMIEVTVPVSWTTIKDIWAKGIEHFAAAPAQESE